MSFNGGTNFVSLFCPHYNLNFSCCEATQINSWLRLTQAPSSFGRIPLWVSFNISTTKPDFRVSSSENAVKNASIIKPKQTILVSIGLYLQRKQSSFVVTNSRLVMFGNTVAVYCDDQRHIHTNISHGTHTSAELLNHKAGGTNAVIPEFFKPLTFSFS